MIAWSRSFVAFAVLLAAGPACGPKDIPPPPKVDPKAKPDPKKKDVKQPVTKFTVTVPAEVVDAQQVPHGVAFVGTMSPMITPSSLTSTISSRLVGRFLPT